MPSVFLRARCATCGKRIKKTEPPTHVRSNFTGNVYCVKCCVESSRRRVSR